MSFTLNDIALLLIAVAIGMIIGLMISGRGKYRRLWRDERAVHKAAVKDRDTRIVELEKHVALAASPAATERLGAMAERDNLTKIRGISKSQEVALNEQGYQRYAQIAGLDAEQEAMLEGQLGLVAGTIAREAWREQARDLEVHNSSGPMHRATTPV